MIEILFWSSVALIVYTYVGFPVISWIRSRVWKRPYIQEDITPSVSVLIAAHNEEQSIGEKVRNVLNVDYPADQLQVIVASDGSTDRTLMAAQQSGENRVTVLDLPRAGKAAALNEGILHCDGEIVVFSDANSMFAVDAIRRIVRSFADPDVGGVAGDQRYSTGASDSAAADGERSYWGFDRQMKLWQTVSGNVTSATGAIYAVRRSLFVPVVEGVTDDFITSTAVIDQGCRLVFDQTAAAYEPVAKSSGVEFGRKVRVITRGLRGVLLRRALLNPFRTGFYSLQLFSHKVLRRQMVFPILTLLICSLLLSGSSSLYLAAAALQLTFYCVAAVGPLAGRFQSRMTKIISLPWFFCMVNFACVVATWRSLSGQQIVLWDPQRSDLPPGSKPATEKS